MRITDLIQACRWYDEITPALIMKYKNQGRIEEIRSWIEEKEMERERFYTFSKNNYKKEEQNYENKGRRRHRK